MTEPPLDPSAAAVLELLAAAGAPPLETLEPSTARDLYAAMGGGPVDDTGLRVVQRDIAGVPCVVTRPDDDEVRPVLVWLHGGGWVIGSAALSQPVVCGVARTAGCVVVNVDYRLAPEHPFPAALHDVAGVIGSIRDGVLGVAADSGRVAIGGDSAGGNLSAVTAAEVPGLVHQVLVYPSTDMTLSHDSLRRNGTGKLLTESVMRWFRSLYLVDVEATDPR
ncbi:MAG: alpha/beta hydrolase, partial [Actinomycetes bacterium]